MLQIDKKKCVGCMACEAICQVGAIQITEDAKGFLYPEVNMERCVKCGQCNTVCLAAREEHHQTGADGSKASASVEHIEREVESENNEFAPSYYAAKQKDTDILKQSSSGGVFYALITWCLNKGGAIYGAAYHEDLVVRHMRCETLEDAKKLLGSKYVQSDLRGVLPLLAEDLRKDTWVVFSGTPCQVQAVRSYVEKKKLPDARLLLVDFICHGVASPKIWKDYKQYLEKTYQKPLSNYQFRGKVEGWHGWYPQLTFQDTDAEENLKRSRYHRKKASYILLYQTLYLHRQSCFTCAYTSYQRPGDLTLGDFWNIKSVAEELDDNQGTSEVLVNTRKGELVFGEIQDQLFIKKCNSKDVWQPHLQYPNAKPKGYEAFWEFYAKAPFEQVMKRYGEGDAMTKLKNLATPILKKTGLYTFFGKCYEKLFVRK